MPIMRAAGGIPVSSEREKLKKAHAAFTAAQSRVVEARSAVDTAQRSRWKARGDLERFHEEGKEPSGFDDLDGALAAIAGGSAGVAALINTEPRRARQAELEREVEAWLRSSELAEQALAMREKDASAAAWHVDATARVVVAAEAAWPALKQRYDEVCGELRALRAQLASLAEAVPGISSPYVCEVDVRNVVDLSPLYGPERDSPFVDFLAALKGDPSAKMERRAAKPRIA